MRKEEMSDHKKRKAKDGPICQPRPLRRQTTPPVDRSSKCADDEFCKIFEQEPPERKIACELDVTSTISVGIPVPRSNSKNSSNGDFDNYTMASSPINRLFDKPIERDRRFEEMEQAVSRPSRRQNLFILETLFGRK